jgi:methylated-DNA-[protein]-cysteine S-methyltransferase
MWRYEAAGPSVVYIALPGETAILTGDSEDRAALHTVESCREIDGLGADLRRYLDGKDVPFDLSLVALEVCPDFQRAVLSAEYAIPRGEVSTYGRVARAVGRPGAQRAVGQALARNPFPIVIPCHRAVRADGALGGYRGGVPMKRALLRLEGISIDPRGRVCVDRFFY